MRILPIALLLVCCASAGTAQRGDDIADVASRLPTDATTNGWRMGDSVRVFKGNSLYELVDGGADLYFEYGFVQAAAASYERNQARISVELYQMSDPSAAFGVYSYLAAGAGTPSRLYGQESVKGDGFILFWKGRFTAAITTTEGEAPGGLDQIAFALDRNLDIEGERPELAGVLLDARDRVKDIVYFKGPLGYRKYERLLRADLLGVGEGAEARMEGCDVVLLRYPDASDCEKALTSAVDSLQINGGASMMRSSLPGKLFRYRGEIYYLEQMGERMLEVHGKEKARVERAGGVMNKERKK